MEASISVNTDKCSFGVSSSDRLGMGSDGRVIVEVPLRHAKLGISEQIDMEHHSASLSVFDSVQNNFRGKLVCKENARESSHCDNLHEKSTHNEAVASVSTHHKIQLTLAYSREIDGGVGALFDTNAGQRSDEKSCKGDRIEFDGGSEAPTSI